MLTAFRPPISIAVVMGAMDGTMTEPRLAELSTQIARLESLALQVVDAQARTEAALARLERLLGLRDKQVRDLITAVNGNR